MVQVVGLGQLYPYIHLHHVHDDDGTRVVISIHPPSDGVEFSGATTSDEHHHDSDHLALDCNLCQRQLKDLQRQADIIVFRPLTSESVIQPMTIHRRSDPPPAICSPPTAIPEFRGPPSLA
jgi:hypothetical protein